MVSRIAMILKVETNFLLSLFFSYTELEKYEEAVSDYETCFKISKTAGKYYLKRTFVI